MTGEILWWPRQPRVFENRTEYSNRSRPRRVPLDLIKISLLISTTEWLLFFFLEEEGIYSKKLSKLCTDGVAKNVGTMILKRMNREMFVIHFFHTNNQRSLFLA